jgi:hypothetical protein
VIALLRYQSALLLRSHRWIFPVIVYGLLTRSMLAAEPAGARACVSAARGPARAQLAPLAAGLGKALVCALVGSAVGTLFNPPLIRHAAAALLATSAAVVVALVSSVSPASAALRGNGATIQSVVWPAGLPLIAALALAGVSWAVSCWLAGRRAE